MPGAPASEALPGTPEGDKAADEEQKRIDELFNKK